jgi:hypothetical protein
MRVVVLTTKAWQRINGETVSGDLRQVMHVFPQVVRITFSGYELVVVAYEDWKQKVLHRQQEGGREP